MVFKSDACLLQTSILNSTQAHLHITICTDWRLWFRRSSQLVRHRFSVTNLHRLHNYRHLHWIWIRPLHCFAGKPSSAGYMHEIQNTHCWCTWQYKIEAESQAWAAQDSTLEDQLLLWHYMPMAQESPLGHKTVPPFYSKVCVTVCIGKGEKLGVTLGKLSQSSSWTSFRYSYRIYSRIPRWPLETVRDLFVVGNHIIY